MPPPMGSRIWCTAAAAVGKGPTQRGAGGGSAKEGEESQMLRPSRSPETPVSLGSSASAAPLTYENRPSPSRTKIPWPMRSSASSERAASSNREDLCGSGMEQKLRAGRAACQPQRAGAHAYSAR